MMGDSQKVKIREEKRRNHDQQRRSFQVRIYARRKDRFERASAATDTKRKGQATRSAPLRPPTAAAFRP